MITFREQSVKWLERSLSRARRPIRPTSVPSIRSALDKWILKYIGDLPLDKVHNGSCKPLVQAMQKEKLSSKTQNSYMQIVKAIVASLIDDESGEPLVMRKWSAEVMDLPIIEHAKTPVFSRAEVERLLARSSGWERFLYTLLAATGMRISECLALEVKHISPDGRTLLIEQQVNRFGKIAKGKSGAKTKAGLREVDLDPEVTKQLLKYADKKEGLLFPSRAGTPLDKDNLAKRRLSKHTHKGWHAFRRFRTTWLSEAECNPDVKKFWLGWSAKEMHEIYSKLKHRREFRLREAERVNLGFNAKIKTQLVRKGRKLVDAPFDAEEQEELRKTLEEAARRSLQ